MANIYDVAGAIQQPNIPGAVQAGVQTANQNALGNIAVRQAMQQQNDAQTIRQIAPQVVAGDPSAYAQAAAISPDQANSLQSAGDAQLAKIRGAINYLDSQTTPQAKEAAYQNAVKPFLAPLAAANGHQVPDDYASAQAGIDAMRAKIATLGAAPGQNSALINVGAGGAIFDPITKQPIFQNNQKPPQLVTGADGRQYWATPGGAATPIQISNGQASVVGGPAGATSSGLPAETRNYVPSVLAKLGNNAPLNADGTASPALVQALVAQESGGNPNAVSPKGAQGLTQIMNATGANPGFGVTPLQNNSPQENLRFGQDYLNAMLKRYGGDVNQALAAYNAGPGTVDNASGGPQYLQGQPKKETFTPLSADEVAAAGLPKGTVAQRGSNGKIEVVSKPSANDANVTAPGDTTKTGADYLATLPPSTARLVPAIANGDKAAPSASSRSPEAQQLLQAVYQYDPTASDSNLPTRTATRKSFTSGKDSQNLAALSQFAAHAEQLGEMIPRISGTAINVPLFADPLTHAYNAAVNSQNDPATGNLKAWQAKADAVAHEGRAVFAGAGGGTLDELNKQAALLDSSGSTQQKQAALAAIADLVRSRIGIMQNKYQEGMGPASQPLEVVSPHVRDALNSLAAIDHKNQSQPAQPTDQAASTVPPDIQALLSKYPGSR